MDKLKRDMDFIIELDKIKSIKRKTNLIGSDEKEDDAQHSWHISMMALVLEEYADEELDSFKVIQMLLIHDIVEIYAGDTFAYDKKGYEDKLEREEASARKIYGMLGEKGDRFMKLWQEFESMESPEALFAAALDRLQPILNNYYNQGGTWVEYSIKKSDVLERISPIKEISGALYGYALDILDDSIEKGYLLED